MIIARKFSLNYDFSRVCDSSEQTNKHERKFLKSSLQRIPWLRKVESGKFDKGKKVDVRRGRRSN